MARLCYRPFAKLLSASIVAGVISSPSSAFAGTMPPLDEGAHVFSLSAMAAVQAHLNAEALAKELAMSTADLVDRWAPHIKEASRRFKISADWIKAVIRMESGGRTLGDDAQPITSSAGAMGIMQVMPDAYRDMQEQYGLGADPHHPRDNILAGTAYLCWLKEKYGFPKMFAAYNAGPATLEAQTAGKRKLPKETRDYIKRISVILGVDDVTASPAQPAQPAQPKKIIATLTRPGGSTVTIDGDTVDKIRAVLPNEFIAGVKTVVIMGQRMQGVLEDVATVTATLRPRVSALYLPNT